VTPAELRAFCLSLPASAETFPFEPGVSVFKAANGKMFAVSTLASEPLTVTVKCDPELAVALRAEYASIVEGYHLNKRHWITITLGADCPDERARQLVQDSHDLVAPR
jgi:predicted DNA-binding protein (MmcQ/YjbR family)